MNQEDKKNNGIDVTPKNKNKKIEFSYSVKEDIELEKKGEKKEENKQQESTDFDPMKLHRQLLRTSVKR